MSWPPMQFLAPETTALGAVPAANRSLGPERQDHTGSASSIVAVRGAGSFWATGTLTPVKTGTPKTYILRYTP